MNENSLSTTETTASNERDLETPQFATGDQEIILCLHRNQLFRFHHRHEANKQQPVRTSLESDDCVDLVDSIKSNLANHINQLGQKSAKAQQLKTSITTYDKLMQNQDNEYLYFMIDQQSIPKGYIRICKKKLFLDEMDQLKEYENCLCVMDFFVIKRKEGTGLKLIMYASNDLNLQPKDLLIDRPSQAMINFMKKHFNLKPLHHYNKFASFV